MRAYSYILFAALLVLPYGAHAHAQSTATNIFAANLSLGSSGASVVALQQFLNRDSDTRIASTGPGSVGQETSYFGQLTKVAVVRFQEKYANEILLPAGLTRGNGYVGLNTRAKLNSLSALAASGGTGTQQVAPPSSAVTLPSVPGSSAPLPSPVISSENPNLKNIDRMLAAIETVAAKQGLSAAAVMTIKQAVMQTVATTTDLRATFLKQLQDVTHQSVGSDSFSDGVLVTMRRMFGKFFMPEHALAQTAAVPFGGALFEAIPCNGGVWNITLEPLPPAYPVLLSYVLGSEAFASYNIPATPEVLGFFAPGEGICFIGHVFIPSEGVITSDVGSAPL